MTVIALDVDGCLNPWNAWDRDLSGLDFDYKIDHFTFPNGASFRVKYSPGHGEAFQSLIDDGATFLWATSWVPDYEPLEKLATSVGLPVDAPRIPYDQNLTRDPDEQNNCGKRPTLQFWLEENGHVGDKLIWIDDCLGKGDFEWAESRPGESLLIKPKDDEGLTLAHFEQMQNFHKSSTTSLDKSDCMD